MQRGGQHKGKGFAVPVPSWGVLEKEEPESPGRGGGKAWSDRQQSLQITAREILTPYKEENKTQPGWKVLD